MSRLARWTAALGAALVLTCLPAVPAYADETWCDVDPAIPLKDTSNGTIVVFLNTRGPSANLAAMKHPDESYLVTYDAQNNYVVLTLNYVDSTGGADPLVSEIWTKANRTGTLLSSQPGVFGQSLVHTFTVSRG